MGVIVRPFRTSDYDAFKPLQQLPVNEHHDPELAKAIEESELAVTGCLGNRIIGCGGVHPVTKEHGEMWLRLSDYSLTHRIATLRWLIEGLKIIEETFPFKRLSAVIQCDFDISIKLVQFLGFKYDKTKVVNGRKFVFYDKMVSEDDI